MDIHQSQSNRRIAGILIFSAWTSILIISELPDILISAVGGDNPAGMLWVKAGYLALFFGLSFLWKGIRPLRPLAFVMLVFFAALSVSGWVRTSVWWLGLISESQPSFALGWSRPMVGEIGVTLLVLAGLWIIKRRRNEFFPVKGQLDAPIQPVRWLGIRRGESWRSFRLIFALVAANAVALPTLLVMRPSLPILLQAARYIPAVLVFAAINAFMEEVNFRLTLLTTLPDVIGKNQPLLINSAFFGFAH